MSQATKHLLLYWGAQLAAWTGYMALLGLPVWLAGDFTPQYGQALLAMVVIGIASSHALRSFYREWQWADLSLERLLPRVFMAAVVLGLLAGIAQAALHDAAFPDAEHILGGSVRRFAETTIGWVLQLLAWALAYIAYRSIVRGRVEELRALRLESANREGQLANLRSQLNPHFMFNALNSIRSLIEEDPERAKQAITRLSAILRNAMATVKRRTVPLGEEIDMVRAYLDLEAMRYEERLRVRFDIDPALEREPVPPMMLQTLVENAVRHGIAKLPGGGEVAIIARSGPDNMHLSVSNTGQLDAAKPRTEGIGLRNTRKRLRHIYGYDASIKLSESNGHVVCDLIIPKLPETVKSTLETEP
ncbi:MAG: histidine kinase [Flavobacteriales bacterium]|jgi:two-component system LytT family sensor kinase|nr:histidine kinase [Flavobacteriales bacterium]